MTHTFGAGCDPCDYLPGERQFRGALEDAMGGKAFLWNTPEPKRAYPIREMTYQAIAGAGG